MFRRRRTHAYFEPTPDGRGRLVVEQRRRSFSGHSRRAGSPDDDDTYRDQDRRLLAQNEALNNENLRLQHDIQRLCRDNQTLSRAVNELTRERDDLTRQIQRGNGQEGVVRELQQRLHRERRRVREERAERAAQDAEREERASEIADELRLLRSSERRWRTAVAELTREVEGWVRVSREKEGRIRELEAWIRRSRGVLR